MSSTTEWARAHGVHTVGTVALDNYEPCPRGVMSLDCYAYDIDGRTSGYVIDGAMRLRDGNRAVYLIDDGRTVVPHYVAAWHPDGSHVIAHAFPTNYDADGNRVTRADDGRPVDYGTWMLGPRRAYHVKLVTS
jgi:hypothetical protein